MNRRKVISTGNFGFKLPLGEIAIAYLLLDRFSAPGWAYGIVFTILGLICICAIVSWLCFEKSIDIFSERDNG